MVIRTDKDGTPDRVSTRCSALSDQTLISLTANYPHQQLIDKQLAKAGIACRLGLTVNLLDTQIGLVEAEEGIAVIPSFGLPACRSRKVSMSELVEPLVTLEFFEISGRARKLPAEASEFSAFLKKYIARWAGEAGALRHSAPQRHLLASGEAGEIEARPRRYDGDYHWFLFRVEPVRDNHGNILVRISISSIVSAPSSRYPFVK